MSFDWKEPAYLRQARELATQFNSIVEMSVIQKSVSALQAAFDSELSKASLKGISTALETVKFAMPAIKIQTQLTGQLSSVFDQMSVQSVSQISDSLLSAAESLRPVYEMQDNLSGLFNSEQLIEIVQESAAWKQNYASILEAFTPLFLKIDVNAFVQPLLEYNSALLSSISEYAHKFDFGDLDVRNGMLVYDGYEYPINDLQQELDEEIAVVEDSQSLRARYENNNGLFIIAIILYLFLSFPQIDEAISWYHEKIETLQGLIQPSSTMTADVYAFTIKDITYLRVEPNAKSEKLSVLVYDTKIRVVSSETPRWLNVEYTYENGQTITGWVSKISVEIEEH